MFGKTSVVAPPVEPANQNVNGIAELEAKINAVCRATGVDPRRIEARASDESPLPTEIMTEIHDGRLIQAIKMYRDSTGASLKEAKDTIDAAAKGSPFQNQPRFTVLQAKLDAILARLEDER